MWLLEFARWESVRRRVNGTEVHWVEAGRGPALLLIHGLTDSHRSWRRVITELADSGYRVLAIDLPGHGLSSRPDASYSLDFHARVVLDLLDSLSLWTVDLVGHSYGGAVAMAMVRARPRLARSLALVASGGLGNEVALPAKLLTLPGIDGLVQAGLALGTRLGLLVAQGRHADPAEREWHAFANATPGTARALTRTAQDVLTLNGQRDTVHRHLGRIRLPRLGIFWGDKDAVVPYVHGVRLAAAIPGSKLYRFRGSGHFPHLERAHAFTAALSQFLNPQRLQRKPRTVVTEPRLRRALSHS